VRLARGKPVFPLGVTGGSLTTWQYFEWHLVISRCRRERRLRDVVSQRVRMRLLGFGAI